MRRLVRLRSEGIIKSNVEIEVIDRLRRKHSLEQISGGLRRMGLVAPSRTCIYSFIESDRRDGGELYLNLQINGKRRYRYRNKASRHKLPARIGIEARPAVVASRKRYGDWEVDLIAGCRRGGHLLSLYERKSRTGKLFKLTSKDSESTAHAIIETLQGMLVHTITYDNGLEFAGHQLVSESLGAYGYFC